MDTTYAWLCGLMGNCGLVHLPVGESSDDLQALGALVARGGLRVTGDFCRYGRNLLHASFTDQRWRTIDDVDARSSDSQANDPGSALIVFGEDAVVSVVTRKDEEGYYLQLVLP